MRALVILSLNCVNFLRSEKGWLVGGSRFSAIFVGDFDCYLFMIGVTWPDVLKLVFILPWLGVLFYWIV
jgi:hypothetical protein